MDCRSVLALGSGVILPCIFTGGACPSRFPQQANLPFFLVSCSSVRTGSDLFFFLLGFAATCEHELLCHVLVPARETNLTVGSLVDGCQDSLSSAKRRAACSGFPLVVFLPERCDHAPER
jgi:hypothetical protein